VLQAEQEKATRRFRDDLLPTPQFTFSWDDHPAACRSCGRPLCLRRSYRRHIWSITYGGFVAVERQGYCPTHPQVPDAHSQQLARIAAPGAEYAYDVLAWVGVERFLCCRQYEEIRNQLSAQHGLDVPVSTVAYLARKFVAYFQVVHQQSIRRLRGEMERRGGFILHVDGTCEEGSGVLLVCMDSLSGQVLESRKISSENHDEIRDLLRDLRQDWGVPLAIVHDLRRSLITATEEVFPEAPQFVCHYHLAADVGKDILSTHEDRLRRLFRSSRVRAKLRALIRALQKSAVCPESGQHRVNSVLSGRSHQELPPGAEPEAAQGVAHALAAWILAYSQDGEGYGFPFASPHRNLYERVLQVHQMLGQACPSWPERGRGPLNALHRLQQILEPVTTGTAAGEFREVVGQMQRDQKIFDQFRAALRICPRGGKERRNDPGAPKALSAGRHQAILKKLRTVLVHKARSAKACRRACTIVVRHLDKYWPYLFGHALHPKARGGPILVPRTNNVEEGLFRIVKRQCRRLHGRGHLARDLSAMLPGTPLVLNLTHASYCQTVYGGREAEKIATAFSTVDPQVPARLLETWRQQKLSTAIPQKFEKLKNFPQQVAAFISGVARRLRKKTKKKAA
jgi:hypothetical protein